MTGLKGVVDTLDINKLGVHVYEGVLSLMTSTPMRLNSPTLHEPATFP